MQDKVLTKEERFKLIDEKDYSDFQKFLELDLLDQQHESISINDLIGSSTVPSLTDEDREIVARALEA